MTDVATEEISPKGAREYVIVYDGDPLMDGSRERLQTSIVVDNLGAAEYILNRVQRPHEKPNLRIESRLVGPWQPYIRDAEEAIDD